MTKTKGDTAVEKRKYRVKLPYASAELRERCMNAAKRKYGASLPLAVSERLEKELNAINAGDYASHYLIGAMLAERSLAEGYPVSTRGMLGSSLAAHLCGITSVNPLPAHYWCPKCHHFELYRGADCGYQVMGYNLTDKECPECGALMMAEGADIEPEILMGIKLDKEPDIILNVAEEVRPMLINYLKEVFGERCVVRGGVKVVLENGSIRRNVHPGGIFILPTDVDIKEITSLREDIPDDEFHLSVTEEDYHKIDGILKKYDLLTIPELSMLKWLEEQTHFPSCQIKTNSREVLEVFRNEGFSFLPGKLREAVEALPDRIMHMMQPGCFSEVVKILAMMHGTGTWNNNGEFLIQSGRSLSECIACRDDIMQKLLAVGLNRDEAYEIMNHVRLGKGVTEKMSRDMQMAGIPDWYVQSCRKLTYLFPRAHAVEYMLLYWKLAYYRLHYPGEYLTALCYVDKCDADAPW